MTNQKVEFIYKVQIYAKEYADGKLGDHTEVNVMATSAEKAMELALASLGELAEGKNARVSLVTQKTVAETLSGKN